MKLKKYKLTITIIFLLFIFLFFNNNTEAADYNLELGSRVLKFESKGGDVALLQKKLKKLSYYDGPIDGLYGIGTCEAVKKFQRKNSLSVDGIVGEETFQYFTEKKLLSRMSVRREDIILLARIIHGEARGEKFSGKVGVGAVILNRIKSNQFPDSIREVILQKGQFSCLIDGQANAYPDESSIAAAKAAIIGYDPTYKALYFYNPEVATNLAWIEGRPIVTKIDNHVFAR